MSTSQRDKEGYFMIDHSHTIGVPDSLMEQVGLPAGSGKGLFEAPTFTCSHCQSVVIMNPDRKRARTHCRGCDHMICDGCAAIKAVTLKCRTFKQVLDELVTEAETRQAEGLVILPGNF